MRKKGLVEKMVMKPPAEENFSPDQFPKNRGKLFLYMLKNKFPKIYKNHLLISLFFLPLIAWGVLTIGYTDWFFKLEAAEGINHFGEYWFTVYVTAIPLWAIAFVGVSGGLNVIRKLAWSDPVILKTDFLQGIKSGGKQIALIGFLWGTVHALVRYAYEWLGLYHRAIDGSPSVTFGIFICIFVMLALAGLTVYMTCMSSLYNVTLGQLLAGAFKLYFSDFFLASGVMILCILPIIILMHTGYIITLLIAYFLLLALLIGVVIIPMFLVCQHTFDRVINKKDYPIYYGRGLSYGDYSVQNVTLDDERQEDLEEKDMDIDNKNQIENDFERVNDECN